MSPFQEYLEKSKEVRAEYAERINNNPAQADQLNKELKEVLSKLLDECEAKEIARSKHL